MRIALDIVVRLAAVLGVWYLFMNVIEIPGDDDGIGTGLLAFATLLLVSGAWGTYDGFRRPYAHLTVVWVATGLLFAVGSEVLDALSYPTGDWSLMASDVLESIVLFACLVTAPALIAAVLGALVNPRNNQPRTQPRPQDGHQQLAP